MAYNHRDIVLAMAKKFPALLQGVNDAHRRTFTQRVAETLKCRYPAEGWACKAASPTRPQSKDAIVDGTMRYYDILTASGTANPVPGWHEGDLIPDQHRIEVSAFDWLALEPDTDPPGGTTTPIPDDQNLHTQLQALAEFDAALAVRVAGLEAGLAELRTQMSAMKPGTCACQGQRLSSSREWGHAHTVTLPGPRTVTT